MTGKVFSQGGAFYDWNSVDRAQFKRDRIAALRWCLDAVLDGWNQVSGKFTDDTTDLARDGYLVRFSRLAYTAHDKGKSRAHLSLCAWGPDKLVVELPTAYDWPTITGNMKRCSECGAVGEMVQVGFAGRVCPACRIKLAPSIEFAGWTK